MCGSVIEAVQDMAKDVLGTPHQSRSDAAGPVDDLFASTDYALADHADATTSQHQELEGDLFGDVGTAVTPPELAADDLSGFGALSGLVEAEQVVIPEGYSPPPFAIETTAVTDNFGDATFEPAELDPSLLITERDFDIGIAFDMPVDVTPDNNWNTSIEFTDLLGNTPINYERL